MEIAVAAVIQKHAIIAVILKNSLNKLIML